VPGQWARATAVVTALRAVATDLPTHGRVHDSLPVEIGPGAFATVVSGPVEQVAEPLLRDILRPAGADAGWPWLPSLSRRLGEHLRLRHQETRGLPTLASLASPNPVIARVEDLLGGAPRQPARMNRLAGTVAAHPRLSRALCHAVVSCQSKRRDRVLLHGRFAPAAILRSTRAGGVDVVYAWLDAMQGPAAYDLGYFVGELAECEAIARALGRTGSADCCRRAIATFVAGYTDAGGRLRPNVSAGIAPFAALKIVEHVARFTQRFGAPGSDADHLLAAANDLLDPRGWLTQLLAEA
jgi:hypothetical protein